MSRTSRRIFIGVCLGAAALARVPDAVTSARVVTETVQVELDRIVSRVNGHIITQSDVRQARALRLVDDTSSDAAARRELENRWLVLAEIARAAPLPPATDADLAARRAEWQAGLGGRAGSAPMSDADVQTWLRDDLRIRAYLTRQFGMLPDADRGRARAEWLNRLRQRAELD